MLPVPVIAGIALAVTAIGLRIRAVEQKKKALAAATPATPVTAQSITPAQVAAAAQQSGVSVPEFTAAAKAVGATPQDLVAAGQNAGSAAADMIAAAIAAGNNDPNAAGPSAGPGPAPSLVQTAIVTTNDPPPSGDLIIRSAPSANAAQIGGAEKGGLVTILDPGDSTFSKIQWDGGSRLPAATGFARKAFLVLQ